jgi:hypothetical protein
MINALKDTDPELHRKSLEFFKNAIALKQVSFRGEVGRSFDE